MTGIRSSAFRSNQLTEITFLGDRPALVTDSFQSNLALSVITYCEGQAGRGIVFLTVVPTLRVPRDMVPEAGLEPARF